MAASTSSQIVGREGALRAEVGGALRRVRAYARDVEEGLERDRMRLEEVLKVRGRRGLGLWAGAWDSCRRGLRVWACGQARGIAAAGGSGCGRAGRMAACGAAGGLRAACSAAGGLQRLSPGGHQPAAAECVLCRPTRHTAQPAAAECVLCCPTHAHARAGGDQGAQAGPGRAARAAGRRAGRAAQRRQVAVWQDGAAGRGGGVPQGALSSRPGRTACQAPRAGSQPGGASTRRVCGRLTADG